MYALCELLVYTDALISVSAGGKSCRYCFDGLTGPTCVPHNLPIPARTCSCSLGDWGNMNVRARIVSVLTFTACNGVCVATLLD